MNERIRELAEQAGYKPLSPPTFADELNEIFMRKFAELIVEECRYVMDCNKGSDQNPAWNQALSETSLKIKQHFGVER
jgi:hypothetical protein